MMPTGEFPTELSGDNHYISLNEDTRKLVILFSAKNLAPNMFNFWQVGQELRANLIFVNNGKNEWYQNGIPSFGASYEETLDTLRAWVKALDVKAVYTIGTSMGAYAAIQYGIDLEARVLAFAADVELSHPHTRSARDMIKSVTPVCEDLRQIIGQAKQPIQLIVGENDPSDVWSASLLSNAANVEAVSLQGVDHYVPSYLTRSSQFAPLLSSFVADKSFKPFSNEGQALSVDGYPQALFEAYKLSEQQEWEACGVAAATALDLYPYAAPALYLSGRAQMEQENYPEAAESFALACTMAPFEADYFFYHSMAVRKDGALDQASFLLSHLLKKWPGHARGHYALGLIREEQGDRLGAMKAIRVAVRIAPKNEAFRTRLKRLAAKE